MMPRFTAARSILACVVFLSSFAPAAAGPAAAAPEPPVLFGMYINDNLSDDFNQDGVTGLGELQSMDAWIQAVAPGKRVSIVGFFVTIELPAQTDQWMIDNEFERAWTNGYTPLVNLMTASTATAIANGTFDADLQDWASRIKTWTDSGRRLFIAPLPEMNGDWTPYGASAVDYKRAFLRLQRLFELEGVADSAVSWVFAPNYKSFGRPPIEDYYPGNAAVDVVGFSAYNYGYCIDHGYPLSFEQLFGDPLATMRTLAPAKPIFILQTGVLDGAGGWPNNYDYKSAWLQDTFTKLAAYPGVRAIIYYHKKKASETNVKCSPVDYRIYKPDEGWGYPGFRIALTAADFGYWAPGDPGWTSTAFVPGSSGVFDDVWPAHPFAGVPEEWYNGFVEALYNAGLTVGYLDESINFPEIGLSYETWVFRPARGVTRAEMAVFLQRGIHGSGYEPPLPDGSSPFGDLAGHWAEAWMEQLYDDGLTSGYPDGTFRPDNGVTRAEMAVFLLKAKYGASYFAPDPTGGSFTDAAGHWAERWIEQLGEEGITAGCNEDGSKFCPESFVNRAQMASFLVRTFNLPMP